MNVNNSISTTQEQHFRNNTREVRQHLLNSYKEKWEGFGNAPSPNLEKLWSDIFYELMAVQTANKLKNMGSHSAVSPINTIFSSTMGSGKTTTIQHYLQNMDTTLYKALVVVELIETSDEYANLLKDKKAVAVHSNNGLNLEDNLDAPILIITHNRLLQMLSRDTADSVFDQYDLVVIDEQVTTYQHIEISHKDMVTRYLPLLRYYNLDKTCSLLDKLVTDLNNEHVRYEGKDFEEVFAKYEAGIDSILDYSECVNELNAFIKTVSYRELGKGREDLDIISKLHKQLSTISKQARMKVGFFKGSKGKTSFNVVIDFLPVHVSKVVFDGTASINKTYELINHHLGKGTIDIRVFHNLRNFSNAKFSYYREATGKSSLAPKRYYPKAETRKHHEGNIKASMQQVVDSCIARWGVDEKVLFVIHKDNSTILESLLPASYEYCYWGNHVGSNQWKDFTKVVVYGLNHYPESVYSAIFYSTFSPRSDHTIAPIDDLRASLLSVDLMQAIFRSQLRKVIDSEGNCPKGTEVLCILPTNNNLTDSILKRIGTVLDKVVIEEIDPIERVNLDSANNKKVTQLINTLNRLKVSKTRGQDSVCILTSTEVEEAYGSSLSRIVTRGSKTQSNINTLASNDWYFTAPTVEERETFSLSGNVRRVFKYVPPFRNEV